MAIGDREHVAVIKTRPDGWKSSAIAIGRACSSSSSGGVAPAQVTAGPPRASHSAEAPRFEEQATFAPAETTTLATVTAAATERAQLKSGMAARRTS